MNPLLYANLPDSNHLNTVVLLYACQKAWINAPDLILVTEADDEPKEIETLLSDTNAYLSKLRHLSGQADMPREDHLISVTWEQVDILPELPTFDESYSDTNFYIQADPLAAAVSEANLSEIARLPVEYGPPIYSTLFLDAISAFRANDYRVSILFSAMAMEIAFGTVLD